MSEYDRLYEVTKELRKQYPVGTRIELISMGADPQPIEAGARGTVTGIDDMASLMVRWDNGRGLNLAYGADKYRAPTTEELEAEKEAQEEALPQSFASSSASAARSCPAEFPAPAQSISAS